ncbi:MAG: twin-arginine translocation signal domain-containing protein [Desulfobacterales bacterium]|nr:twin-arginine translocation signal domain-containing protein [Desulfobacterales bacterium]
MKENEIKKSLSRRTFIKGAAVTAGAIAAIGIGVPKNAMALTDAEKMGQGV